MSKQIIIIDSAEALGKRLNDAFKKWVNDNKDYRSEFEVVLACLHPIEVPSDAEELVDKVREEEDDECGDYVYVLSDTDAAALITARERVVPRAMLLKLYDIAIEILDVPWMVGMPTHVKQFRKKAIAIAAKYGYRAE